MQNLKDIFDLFDKEQAGSICARDLETIMGSLQRDPNEVREFLDNLTSDSISFNEFINLMQNVENRIV